MKDISEVLSKHECTEVCRALKLVHPITGDAQEPRKLPSTSDSLEGHKICCYCEAVCPVVLSVYDNRLITETEFACEKCLIKEQEMMVNDAQCEVCKSQLKPLNLYRHYAHKIAIPKTCRKCRDALKKQLLTQQKEQEDARSAQIVEDNPY